MGVQGLWTILEPAARPVKLETLAKKRLAVDASIWIYQFLKAVRDKEGQALRNSHIVGFFRRICKLLFFGIKPVFVFDGGAPALKRQTLASRAQRREGRKEDATRTAGKMLALQMRRRAEMQMEREKMGVGEDNAGDQIGDDVVYFGELDMRPEERKRKFRKTDQYHLPNLEFPLERMAGLNDTRILTENELEQYAKDYHLLEDLSHYDFSKLDFDSDYFRSLPLAEQYSILNAARLRSRLRMGYSKEQLDDMFPDRLAFSRFQIQRLKERNDYTQRLMNLNGMNDVGPQRIAGEKGREYYLVRNESGEGGWVLGVAGPGGAKEKPVLVDVDNGSEEDDEDFEDVPLEIAHSEESSILSSIPRLSRVPQRTEYGVHTKLSITHTKTQDENLFIIDEDDDAENVAQEMQVDSDDEAELQAAINLSMQTSQTPSSLKDLDLNISYPETAESNDSQLNHAIALSLSHEPPRPTTSSSNNSELQRILEMSREDQNIRNISNATRSFEELDFEDDEAELFERFPLSAKDKGKGKATSVTPEPPMSAGDDDLMKAIEISKMDYRRDDRIDGIGSSKDFEAVGVSPSRPAAILGKSMFRKKAQPPLETQVRGVLPQHREVTEISGKSVRDDVLKEKMPQTSPIQVLATETNSSDEVPVQPPASAVLDTKNPPVQPLSQEPDFLPAVFSQLSPELTKYQPQAEPPQSLSNIESIQSPPDDQYYISDDEDEELMAQLDAEAKEHARFASSINPAASSRPEDYTYYSALNTTNLSEEDFEREMRSLRNQQKKDRRDADEVNQLMVVECQQLLRLFGLPYITAPMEAEAQCAELVNLGLVDGIVTDDSDIFLFGGTRVYKNMFNQGKFVECYLQSDLEKDFNLDRGKFINLAHLLGSDYAEGIPHVGPVNALELLSDFPSERGLEEFRNWWIAVQQGRTPKDAGESEFRRKFRKNSTKIFLPNDFPNRVIDQAYLKPEVDRDPQPFVWGVPDLDSLRSFLMSQIGWTKERTDEILVPVIKDMNRRQIEGNQTNLTDFFEGNVGSGSFAPRRKVTHRSKRLSKAMANLQRQNHSDDDVQEISPRRMSTKRKRPTEVVKIESDEEMQAELGDESTLEEDSSSDDDNFEMQGKRDVPGKRAKPAKGKKKGSSSARGKKVKA